MPVALDALFPLSPWGREEQGQRAGWWPERKGGGTGRAHSNTVMCKVSSPNCAALPALRPALPGADREDREEPRRALRSTRTLGSGGPALKRQPRLRLWLWPWFRFTWGPRPWLWPRDRAHIKRGLRKTKRISPPSPPTYVRTLLQARLDEMPKTTTEWACEAAR